MEWHWILQAIFWLQTCCLPVRMSGVLFRVNPASGNRTVVSDFNNSAQGTLEIDRTGVAIVPPQPRLGDILVIDPEAGANGNGALFIVDLFNGSRSLISNFGNDAKGISGLHPFGVAIDAKGIFWL